MSLTHYNGQRIAECPDCDRTIRLKPERVDMDSHVTCGNCGAKFDPY